MHYLPTILFPNHDELAQPMFFDDAMSYGLPQSNAIFYSTRDGNWSDLSTWGTVGNAGRYGLPGANDVVYVRHNVTVNMVANCYNLFVAGSLLFDGTARTITVNGDIQATGVVDMSNGAHNLVLMGVNNYIATFTGGTTATVTYARIGNQPIADVTYRNLTIQGTGTKSPIANLLTNGNVSITGGILDFGLFDANIGGTTVLYNFANVGLSKTGAGNILFQGIFTAFGAAGTKINFSGNPDIEFRGGNNVYHYGYTSGTGIYRYTTNNQNAMFYGFSVGYTNLDSAIIVGSGVAVTFVSGRPIYINNSLTGIDGTSVINVNPAASIYFNNISYPTMTVGVFNMNTGGTVGYTFNGSYTLPYSTYQGLYIAGTGTKSPPSDLTVNGAFSMNGSVDLLTYNISVSGTITITSGTLTKSTSGTLLFVGRLYLDSLAIVNFSGNPDIEFRGGIVWVSNVSPSTGTGNAYFTTNNQLWMPGGAYKTYTTDWNVLISGAITLSIGNGMDIIANGTINGDNISSKITLYNTFGRSFRHRNIAMPMITGILDCATTVNIFKYDLTGNQDITGGTYRTLEFGGSGVKKLMGNVVVTGTYTLSGTATVDLNGFTLTHP